MKRYNGHLKNLVLATYICGVVATSGCKYEEEKNQIYNNEDKISEVSKKTLDEKIHSTDFVKKCEDFFKMKLLDLEESKWKS